MATGSIKNILKVTTIPISYTAGANVSIRAFAAYRSGSIVVVEVYFDVSAAISNNGIILNFSSGLPVPVTGYVTASVRGALNNSMALVSLEAADTTKIVAWGAISVGEYYYASFNYVAP